ncbi:MAG: efflux RND transporter permease subunit [Muribaculaceae bacterium]|nr:efflux RND transporter permease subunit [Muribaculaceae bacterium]
METDNNNSSQQVNSADFQQGHDAPPGAPKANPIVKMGMKYSKEIILILSMLMALGVYALYEMQKQEFPSFTIREGVVAAVYPGASTRQMEEEVLKPLEDYIFSYKEVNKGKTHAQVTSGMVIIFVELDADTEDTDSFWNEFKIGMEQEKLKLPPGVLAVETISDFGATSSLLITMQSADKTYRELHDYMERLKDAIRPVESVGSMTVTGEQKEQVSVYLDPKKLQHYALNEGTLGATLLAQGFKTTGGELKQGDFTTPVYVARAVRNLEDVANMVVMSPPEGNLLRLRDIAEIKREYPKPESYITNNFKKCILLSIGMKDGYNVVEMGKEVQSRIDKFKESLPESVTLFNITDQPVVVNSSVNYFLVELLIAVIAVVVVIMILLPLKVALIAAMTIPISIFISLALFYAFGIELNTVTLACLILSLGMIVDNSVVIIDDYVELISEGIDHFTATLRAGTEFFKAIFSATLAISITFFPFLFTIKGMFRDFLNDFPWGLTIILFVSLIIAELLVPFLQYKLIKKPIYKLQEEALKTGKKKFTIFSVMQKGYDGLIRLCFAWPKTTIATGVLCVILGGLLFVKTPMQLMPIAERNQFAVEIFMPTGTSLEKTSEIADSLERILSKDPEVVSIASFHGCSSPRFQTTYAPQIGGPNYAQFIVNTKSNQATIDVLNRYTDKYEGWFADALIRFKQLSYSTAANPIEIRFSGEDQSKLAQICDSVIGIARNVPGLRNVHSSLGNPLMSALVELDPVRSQRLGLNPTILEATLAMRYSPGLPAATMWEGDYGIPVVLKTSGANAGTPEQLMDEPVPVNLIGHVPLSQVAGLRGQVNPGTLTHYSGVPTVSLLADVQRDINVIERTEALMDSIVSKIEIPEGVTMTRGGDWENTMETLPEIGLGLVIAVVIIFFILMLHYAQVDTAVLLLLCLLLTIPGAAIGLRIQSVSISLTCVLGIVSLMGILVRNAIVLLDYAEELRNQGMTSKDAIYHASMRRMRPIFLTSAAATMGVLPMIIGDSALWKPMGVVIFWGTPITMIFILTVIPVAYGMIKERIKGADQPLQEPLETHLL